MIRAGGHERRGNKLKTRRVRAARAAFSTALEVLRSAASRMFRLSFSFNLIASLFFSHLHSIDNPRSDTRCRIGGHFWVLRVAPFSEGGRRRTELYIVCGVVFFRFCSIRRMSLAFASSPRPHSPIANSIYLFQRPFHRRRDLSRGSVSRWLSRLDFPVALSLRSVWYRRSAFGTSCMATTFVLYICTMLAEQESKGMSPRKSRGDL